MKKTAINLFQGIILSCLLVFTSCNNNSTQNDQKINPKDSVASEVAVDTITNHQTKKEQLPDPLMQYLGKLKSGSQLQQVLLNNEIIKGKEKYEFKYFDNWFSIAVNDNGISYTGIYKLNQDDTLLQYASIVPEIYMEGTFINYEMEPEFEYYYKNKQLSHTKYYDPEDKEAINPFENLDEKEAGIVGDSIKRLIDNYLYLDSLNTTFSGAWKYSKGSDSYDFNVELKQIGNFVFGSYCAYTPTKHDCGNIEQGGPPCYIDGYVYSDTLYLKYFSCYAGESGLAELYIDNDTLNWHTKKSLESSLVIDEIKFISK